MNSTRESEPSSHLPGLSDRPGFHYFLTFCILALVRFPFSWARGYNCLSSGHDYECTYDLDRLQALGGGGSGGGADLLLNSLLITLFVMLLALLMVRAMFAPIYLIAIYISRRCRIRRNLAGVIFWIATWIMMSLGLPLIEARHMFDPGHVSWHGDISNIIISGIH